MKKYRISAVLLICAICASLLSSCGSKNYGAGKPSETPTLAPTVPLVTAEEQDMPDIVYIPTPTAPPTPSPTAAPEPTPAPPTAPPVITALIEGTDINFREEPSRNGRIITRLQDGQVVVYLGAADGWAHVSFDGTEGYVSADFVREQAPPPVQNPDEDQSDPSALSAAASDAPPAAETARVGYINDTNVRFRENPSTEARIINFLEINTQAEILEKTGDWYKIKIGPVEGYVSVQFVTPGEDVPMELIPRAPIAPRANDGVITIAIDAGHQARGNNGKEPIGPGASETKAKVSSGTQGVSTKVPEYILTLAVSLKLRGELAARGYNVYMIRETNDVNISNKDRAAMATNAGADILVRLHADAAENSKVSGILTLCPSANNSYVSNLYADSRALSDDILSAMIELTGAKDRGVSEVDNMSGINWSTMPVTIVEMGLMTNPAEDELMQTEEYQVKLAVGIADGIDKYFSR